MLLNGITTGRKSRIHVTCLTLKPVISLLHLLLFSLLAGCHYSNLILSFSLEPVVSFLSYSGSLFLVFDPLLFFFFLAWFSCYATVPVHVQEN